MPADTQAGIALICLITGGPLVIGILLGYWIKSRLIAYGWWGLLPLPGIILRRRM